MDISVVSLTVTMMGIIILLGTVVSSRLTITKDAKELFMSVIINIAVPFIILNGVFNTEITDDTLKNILLIFGISIAFNSLAIGISFFIGKLIGFPLTRAKQMALLAAIGNSGFIGIPLCATIFGPIGGLFAAIFDAGLDVVLFSVGIYLLQSNERFQWKQLKSLINTPLIAITIGLLFAVSGLDAPVLFQNLASMLSSLAAPLAMLYVGFLLPPFLRRPKQLFYKDLGYPLFMKLIAIPAMTIIIISQMPIDSLIQNILVILACMPTFTLATVLFSRYTNKEQLAVSTTISSTILSLLTIPLLSWFSTFWIS